MALILFRTDRMDVQKNKQTKKNISVGGALGGAWRHYSHVAGFVSHHEGRGESVLVIERTAPQRVAHPRHRSVTWATERESTALIIRNNKGTTAALTMSCRGRGCSWGKTGVTVHIIFPVAKYEHQRDQTAQRQLPQPDNIEHRLNTFFLVKHKQSTNMNHNSIKKCAATQRSAFFFCFFCRFWWLQKHAGYNLRFHRRLFSFFFFHAV